MDQFTRVSSMRSRKKQSPLKRGFIPYCAMCRGPFSRQPGDSANVVVCAHCWINLVVAYEDDTDEVPEPAEG